MQALTHLHGAKHSRLIKQLKHPKLKIKRTYAGPPGLDPSYNLSFCFFGNYHYKTFKDENEARQVLWTWTPATSLNLWSNTKFLVQVWYMSNTEPRPCRTRWPGLWSGAGGSSHKLLGMLKMFFQWMTGQIGWVVGLLLLQKAWCDLDLLRTKRGNGYMLGFQVFTCIRIISRRTPLISCVPHLGKLGEKPKIWWIRQL